MDIYQAFEQLGTTFDDIKSDFEMIYRRIAHDNNSPGIDPKYIDSFLFKLRKITIRFCDLNDNESLFRFHKFLFGNVCITTREKTNFKEYRLEFYKDTVIRAICIEFIWYFDRLNPPFPLLNNIKVDNTIIKNFFSTNELWKKLNGNNW